MDEEDELAFRLEILTAATKGVQETARATVHNVSEEDAAFIAKGAVDGIKKAGFDIIRHVES